MRSSVRVLAAALAIAAQGAFAQTVVPPTVTVQQLAPQLLTFAGSALNFTSLVNGLAAGGPVQLVTVLPNGFSQIVTFTPNAALAPAEIARVLETARQQLIGLGIGTPTAEQIGFTLMGGIVPTALGGTSVNGVLNPQSGLSPAAQLQQRAAGGNTSASPTTPASITPAPGVTSGVNVQFIPNATVTGTTADTTAGVVRRNTSDSPIPSGATSFSPQVGNTSNTPTLPTGAEAGGSLARPAAPAAATPGRRTMN
ncbi:MAG TPA: hypothetical protein VNC62_01685 [Burkholderiales bacterium]|nr:hypothetical protein [Burkholderiales bacterium]